MDKFKAFLSDKKNTPIVGAVAGIVMVLVVLFYLKQFGIIGGKKAVDQNMDMSSDPSMSTPASPSSTPSMTPEGAAPAPTTSSATPPPRAAASIDKIAPMFPYRKDPFMGFGGVPKKSDALMAILPQVRHIRLAPARVNPPVGTAPEVEEPLPPQPMRRVAGIMWGSSVKAIIESGGKTHVVVPGQQIPDEPVRVESIEPSGVILTTLNTKYPMKIRVNLAGSPEGQNQANQDNSAGAPPSGNFGRGSGGRPSGGGNEEARPPGF